MWSRRLERIGGVLGGGLGLAALGVALFAPLSTECLDTPVPGHAGCFPVSQVQLQVQGVASLWFPVALLGGLSLGIALVALWHSSSQSLLALILLWGCTTLFWAASVKTLLVVLSIGVVFMPADLLALTASIAGTVAAGQRVPAPG